MGEWPKSSVACPRVLGMTMDLFGDTLAALHTGKLVATRCECHAPWRLCPPAFAGAGVHVVADGSCVLVPKGGKPLALVAGDLVFLSRGGQHTLCSYLALPPRDYTHDRVAHGAAFGELQIGGPGERTVLACAAYKLDVTSCHPLVASLPEVIQFPVSAERGQALEISIKQIIDETADSRATSPSIVAALVDVLLLRILRAWHDKLPAEQATGWAAAVADPAIAPRCGPSTARRRSRGPLRRWPASLACPAPRSPAGSTACSASRHLPT